MVRLLSFLLFAFPAVADPVSFRESIRVEGQQFPVPMRVSMTALTETELAVTFAGDFSALQASLPAILSREFEDDCKAKGVVAISLVRAEGSDVRLEGRVQYRRFACIGGKRAGELLRQSANVSVILSGRIIDGCLLMRVRDIALEPDGLSGAVLDATGVTKRLSGELEETLDDTLRDDGNCIEVPEEFRMFDAKITGGGFRDVGNGRLGAEIHGLMDINAQNFIRLIHHLGREGRLGE